jgi:cytochrome c5
MRRIFLLLIAGLAVAGGAGAATPAENYMQLCAVCHLPGIAGAPKVGDTAEWARRARPGLTLLYRNALEGIPNTAMMAKGGQTDLSDAEFRAIVDLMLAAARLAPEALAAAARYDKLGITDRDFIRRDANFDGTLTPPELGDDPVLARNFARFDENRDGRLSEAEYRKAEATLERERAAVEVDDATLVAAVRAALAKVKGVDLQYARVEVAGGTVRMTGIVDEAALATRAEDAVKRINGVKKIDNRLVSGHQMGWD